METQRHAMIYAIADTVDGWDMDELISFVKVSLISKYSTRPTWEREDDYLRICCREEYPETFPEGYSEP